MGYYILDQQLSVDKQPMLSRYFTSVSHCNVANLPTKHRKMEIARRVEELEFLSTIISKQQWMIVGETLDHLQCLDLLEMFQEPNKKKELLDVVLKRKIVPIFRYLLQEERLKMLDNVEPNVDSLAKLLTDPKVAALYCEQYRSSMKNRWYCIESCLFTMNIDDVYSFCSIAVKFGWKINICSNVICRLLNLDQQEHRESVMIISSILDVLQQPTLQSFLEVYIGMSNRRINKDQVKAIEKFFDLWIH